MFRWLDRSRALSQLLDWFSNVLAKQRGLPIIAGIAMVIGALPFALLNVFVDAPLVEFIAVILHHVGVLIALIGILLSIPLGR